MAGPQPAVRCTLDDQLAATSAYEDSMELDAKDRLAWQRLGVYRNVDEFRGLRSLMAPEVARCFSPEIHEGQRRHMAR